MPPRRLDIVEICQEASERAGLEFRAGYDLTSARRSLELLMQEWGSKGLNLWTLDRIAIPLRKDRGELVLPEDTIDVLDAAIRNWPGTGLVTPPYASWNDAALQRIPLGAWPTYSQKLSRGRPTGMVVNRVDPPVILLHPIPDRDGGEFIGWRLRHMEQLAVMGDQPVDMPVRFIPALIAGLAYQLASKAKGPAFERVPMLKQLYDEAWELAEGEDRDRSHLRLVPADYSY